MGRVFAIVVLGFGVALLAGGGEARSDDGRDRPHAGEAHHQGSTQLHGGARAHPSHGLRHKHDLRRPYPDRRHRRPMRSM